MNFTFGKHNGMSVEDVASSDPGYLEWICGQSGFREKHPALIEYIEEIGRGSDRTPEHNAIQAKFLDEVFRRKVVNMVTPQPPECQVSVLAFEDFCDVALRANTYQHGQMFQVAVEIKPSVGDDYAKIMRQMQAQRQLGIKARMSNWNHKTDQVLLTANNTSSLTTDQLRAMFATNDIKLLFVDQLDSCYETTRQKHAEYTQSIEKANAAYVVELEEIETRMIEAQAVFDERVPVLKSRFDEMEDDVRDVLDEKLWEVKESIERHKLCLDELESEWDSQPFSQGETPRMRAIRCSIDMHRSELQKCHSKNTSLDYEKDGAVRKVQRKYEEAVAELDKETLAPIRLEKQTVRVEYDQSVRDLLANFQQESQYR